MAVRWRTGDGHIYVAYPGDASYARAKTIAESYWINGRWRPV